jgi:CheY-like chemotaxis protein
MFLFTRLLNGASANQALHLALDQPEAIRLLTRMLEKNRGVARPAAAFVSLDMPRGAGWEFAAWIRAQRTLDNLPVVLMARNPKRADLDHAAKLGAQCCFAKFPGKLAFARILEGVAQFNRNPSPTAFKLPENLL